METNFSGTKACSRGAKGLAWCLKPGGGQARQGVRVPERAELARPRMEGTDQRRVLATGHRSDWPRGRRQAGNKVDPGSAAGRAGGPGEANQQTGREAQEVAGRKGCRDVIPEGDSRKWQRPEAEPRRAG